MPESAVVSSGITVLARTARKPWQAPRVVVHLRDNSGRWLALRWRPAECDARPWTGETLLVGSLDMPHPIPSAHGGSQIGLVRELFRALLQTATNRYRGLEYPMRGNGFLCHFTDPAAAARCAQAIHTAVTASFGEAAGALRVRIGLCQSGDGGVAGAALTAALLANTTRGGATLSARVKHGPVPQSPGLMPLVTSAA